MVCKVRYSILLVLILIVSIFNTAYADPLVDSLQQNSVTVKAGSGQGSGTLFTRTQGNETITFVWTAGHVVDGLRHTRNVIVNGSTKTVVEFDDAAIVQEFREDGRRIGEIKMDAKVIRYSNADNGQDLALLQVRKKNFTTTSAKFYLDDTPPNIGTELYHVGSLLGQFGANSLTTGVISQVGRVLENTVYDQTTATAFPGSSGGGVYIKSDGRYVGMLVRGAGEGFNFIVPVRRLRAWAKDAGVEWAIDPNVAFPTEAEIQKLTVEDAGVTFDATRADKYRELNLKFPFLKIRYGVTPFGCGVYMPDGTIGPPAPAPCSYDEPVPVVEVTPWAG